MKIFFNYFERHFSCVYKRLLMVTVYSYGILKEEKWERECKNNRLRRVSAEIRWGGGGWVEVREETNNIRGGWRH